MEDKSFTPPDLYAHKVRRREQSMKKITLNGTWKVQYFPYGQDTGFIFDDGFWPEGWLETKVPEDIKTVLIRNGLITADYYGKDCGGQSFIEESDWVYYHRFPVDESIRDCRNILKFEGVDTLANVYLNGILLGNCENMHIAYEFDVSHILKFGQTNSLVVKIFSPIKSIEKADRSGLYPEGETDRLLLRKSQLNYGWDFCARSLSTGLWKGVSIECLEDAVIEDYYLMTERIEGGLAYLSAAVLITQEEGVDSAGLSLELEISFKGKSVCKAVYSDADWNCIKIVIGNAELWWPRPYGAANLYDVALILKREGTIIDYKNRKFGIRTVRLIQDRLPAGGRNFQLEINHKRLFVRGANWVPINSTYGEIKESDYTFYLHRAVDANISMLRVWGGGIYEPDLFFELCDREGIMVFQDFMLACGVFPQSARYQELIAKEAAYIIKKYRNYASLVIWSGDNESDQFYEWFAPDKNYRGNELNRKVIRAALEQYDSSRPYLASSPESPFPFEAGGANPNSPLQGDMHIYFGSLQPDNENYYKKIREFVPRFLSEFGFSSLPCIQTYNRFNFYKKPLELGKDPWLDKQIEFAEFIKNDDVPEVIYYSQYIQAHGLKYWIEYLRSYKGICGGVLYWKFNDPIASNRPNMLFPTMMSVIDFYGKEKSAYYYTRRAYEDLILAFREENTGAVAVFYCNETEDSYDGILRTELLRFNGELLGHSEINVRMEADSSHFLTDIPMEEYRKFPKEQCYVRTCFQNDTVTVVNRYMLFSLGECFYAEFIPAQLKVYGITVKENRIELSIGSDVYAQDVVLELLETDACYSDNYFCMDSGEEKRVIITIEGEASDSKEQLDSDCLEGKNLKIKARNSCPQFVDLKEAIHGKEKSDVPGIF